MIYKDLKAIIYALQVSNPVPIFYPMNEFARGLLDNIQNSCGSVLSKALACGLVLFLQPVASSVVSFYGSRSPSVEAVRGLSLSLIVSMFFHRETHTNGDAIGRKLVSFAYQSNVLVSKRYPHG